MKLLFLLIIIMEQLPVGYNENEPIQYAISNGHNNDERVEIMIIEYVDDNETITDNIREKTQYQHNGNMDPSQLNIEDIAANAMLTIGDNCENGNFIANRVDDSNVNYIENRELQIDNLNVEEMDDSQNVLDSNVITYESVDQSHHVEEFDQQSDLTHSLEINKDNGTTENVLSVVEDASNNLGEILNGVGILQDNDELNYEYLEEEYLTETYEDENNFHDESEEETSQGINKNEFLLVNKSNNIEKNSGDSKIIESKQDVLNNTQAKNFVHKCKECSAEFLSETLLKYHRFLYNHDLPFVCCVCKKRIYKLCEIIRHEEQHISGRPYQCLDCPQRFELPHELMHHRKIHITCKATFRCMVCNETFNSSRLLKLHETSHTVTKAPFKCQRCCATFFTPFGLEKHSTRHKFQCTKCGLVSPNTRYFKKHMASHKGMTWYTCDICKEVFTSSKDLSSHIREHQSFEFKCMDCFKTFNKADDLKKHRIIHSNNAYIPILPKPSPSNDFKMVWKS